MDISFTFIYGPTPKNGEPDQPSFFGRDGQSGVLLRTKGTAYDPETRTAKCIDATCGVIQDRFFQELAMREEIRRLP